MVWYKWSRSGYFLGDDPSALGSAETGSSGPEPVSNGGGASLAAFWDGILAPLVQALAPERILEIGATRAIHIEDPEERRRPLAVRVDRDSVP